MRKFKAVDEMEMLNDIEFPDNGEQIIFNMFDNYRNGSIHINDWHRFIRTSYTYMGNTFQGI